MNDKKDKYVTILQAGMLILNILTVGLICGFIYTTTNRILEHYDARTFLDGVVTIPVNPKATFFVCMGMMLILVMTFLIRHIWKQDHNRLIVCTLILDALVCVSLVIQLDFNYNEWSFASGVCKCDCLCKRWKSKNLFCSNGNCRLSGCRL